MYKVEINGDLHNICGRIKEIDPGYYVMFDGLRKRFEVHHRGQRGNTLCVVLPYDRLDARTVVHVRRTRAERMREVVAEMDRENARREREARAGILKKMKKQSE